MRSQSTHCGWPFLAIVIFGTQFKCFYVISFKQIRKFGAISRKVPSNARDVNDQHKLKQLWHSFDHFGNFYRMENTEHHCVALSTILIMFKESALDPIMPVFGYLSVRVVYFDEVGNLCAESK